MTDRLNNTYSYPAVYESSHSKKAEKSVKAEKGHSQSNSLTSALLTALATLMDAQNVSQKNAEVQQNFMTSMSGSESVSLANESDITFTQFDPGSHQTTSSSGTQKFLGGIKWAFDCAFTNTGDAWSEHPDETVQTAAYNADTSTTTTVQNTPTATVDSDITNNQIISAQLGQFDSRRGILSQNIQISASRFDNSVQNNSQLGNQTASLETGILQMSNSIVSM